MSHQMVRLVMQLAVILIAARIGGALVQRYLRQSRVLGELLAGMIIGPHALGRVSLPFLHDSLFTSLPGPVPISPELYGFATLAAIILLFIAGLETDLPTFLRYSLSGAVVGLGGVIVSFLFGQAVAVWLLPGVGWTSSTALFLGTLSTATSIGITARILSERRKMATPEAVTILASAVLDDVIGLALLAMVVGVAGARAGGDHLAWGGILWIAFKALLFWGVCTGLGIWLAPRVSRGLKWFRSGEAIAGISLGLALLLAGLSEMAGLAMIIGGYIMGLSLSQVDIAHDIREKMEGISQMLVPIFFCCMGMMVDFSAMRHVLGFGLVFAGLAVISKLIGCGVPALAMGFNWRGALRIGAGMLPRGEVTLIVAGVGLSSGAIGPDIFGVAVLTLLIATVIAPPLLVRSFEGGPGIRHQDDDRHQQTVRQVVLPFPSAAVADFVRIRLEKAFRNEEFFVHRIGVTPPIVQIRKDEINITMTQHDQQLLLQTAACHEGIMRLIVLEEVLVLKDLFASFNQIETMNEMSHDLLNGLFPGS